MKAVISRPERASRVVRYQNMDVFLACASVKSFPYCFTEKVAALVEEEGRQDSFCDVQVYLCKGLQR